MACSGNTNTLAGNVPPKADLGDLRGLASGLDGRISAMINGGEFDGAKAYKDSKVRRLFWRSSLCCCAEPLVLLLAPSRAQTCHTSPQVHPMESVCAPACCFGPGMSFCVELAACQHLQCSSMVMLWAM